MILSDDGFCLFCNISTQFAPLSRKIDLFHFSQNSCHLKQTICIKSAMLAQTRHSFIYHTTCICVRGMYHFSCIYLARQHFSWLDLTPHNGAQSLLYLLPFCLAPKPFLLNRLMRFPRWSMQLYSWLYAWQAPFLSSCWFVGSIAITVATYLHAIGCCWFLQVWWAIIFPAGWIF